MLRFRVPKKEATPSRTNVKNFVSMLRNVVLILDKLEGGRTIHRRRTNRSKKGEITHNLRESDDECQILYI